MSTTHEPVNDTKIAAQASSSTESVDVQTEGTAEQQEKTLTERTAVRALRRKERWERNHASAEEHSKSGDELLAKKDYAGACDQYLDATALWTSNAKFYSNLAGAYLGCERFIDAAHAATRSLALDPTSIVARYQRGIARLEQRLLDAAKIDFTTVLEQDPTYTKATEFLATVSELIAASAKLGSHELADPTPEAAPSLDFAFPHVTDDRLELASLSDSSDCNHVGNGIPCRFYNHGGCARGAECVFSHAPDEKSVRDNLGQNVCIYHLLGDCRFGELKCVYSHSRTALPMGRGWWNDPAQVARVKGVLEVAEKNAREAREARALETKLRRERGAKRAAAGKAGKRKEKAKEEVNGKDKEGKEKAEETKPNEEKEGPHGKQEGAKAQSGAGRGKRTSEQARSIEDDEDEQRLLNGGFTDYQLNELLEQGVKPWDNDAHAVLEALSY